MSRRRNACPWCCKKNDVIKGGDMIQVRYFLSRMGRIEHAHLIRVEHNNRTAVRLRDVKRWLSDAHGKDMPESYAWSYKRQYKTGYIWHDVLDNDLITPISNNEYVLKGSEMSSSNNPTLLMPKPDTISHRTPTDAKAGFLSNPARVEPEIDEEDSKDNEGLRKSSSERSQPSTSSASSSKGRGSFRGLLSCREVETVEAMLVPIDRRTKLHVGEGREDSSSREDEICEEEQPLRQNSKSSSDENGNSWRKKESVFANQNRVPSIYKPMSEPNCSQCGKAFKPEKLHAHMKSCKVLKALVKGERPIQTPMEDDVRTQGENLRPPLLSLTAG